MKFLTYVLSLLLCVNAFAQSLDESTNTGSLDSQFAETQQLTDAQATEAAEFVHQGVKDRKIKEGCDNKTLKGCDGSSARPGLEDQIGMMYALIFGLGGKLIGGGGSGGSSNGAATTGTNGEAAKPKKDYCIFLPLGYEAISMLLQQSGQNKAAQETANLDPQLASLVQLKEAHKTRKKTATQQSVVYGATSACYAAMLFMPGKNDPMLFVKMGAAGALTMLYMSKAKKHGKAADMIQQVIDGLPKAGDCNPWTGTQCFCSEKTSSKLYPGQFNEVCLLNKGKLDGTLSNMGCAVSVAGKVSLDASCGCKKTNTCLSTKISLGNSTLGMGANFVNDANKGLSLLDPSQYDEAKLNDFASSMAAKIGGIKQKGDVADIKLTPAQKVAADEMAQVAPPAVAAMAAQAGIGAPPVGGVMSGSTSSGLDKIPASLRKELADFNVNGKYRSNGGYSGVGGGEAEQGFSLPGMGGKTEPEGGIQIEEEYAARAIGNADVRNAPETAIFDIISNRYRASAWKRLDAEPK